MKVTDTIKLLLDFFVSYRRSGTTTLLQKIASENDVWVIVETDKERELFGDKALSLNQAAKSFHGLKGKPILVDNHVMLRLLEDAGNEIEHQAIEKIKRDESLFKLYKEFNRLFAPYKPAFEHRIKSTGEVEKVRV